MFYNFLKNSSFGNMRFPITLTHNVSVINTSASRRKIGVYLSSGNSHPPLRIIMIPKFFRTRIEQL